MKNEIIPTPKISTVSSFSNKLFVTEAILSEEPNLFLTN